MCDLRETTLSPREAAAAIGASESSLKRWIDAGDLKAVKTKGGHRRIELAALLDFLARTGRVPLDPAALGLGRPLDPNDPERALRAFTETLAEGDAAKIEALLRQLLIAGEPLATLLDAVVLPAYRVVRAACEHPSETCVVLHRGIEATKRALTSVTRGAPSQGPKLLLADVGYEVDGLPVFLAEAAASGLVRPMQLGLGVPAEVLRGALRTFQPDVLWLSASGPVAARAAIQTAARGAKKILAFGDHARELAGSSATIVGSFDELRSQCQALGEADTGP